VIGAVGLFAIGNLSAPHPRTRGPGGELARFDLTVGQCANGEVSPGNSFGSDAAVSCSQAHELEVYASTAAPGMEQPTGYPDPGDLAAFTDDYCLLAFEAFVGSDYVDSDLDYTGIIPSRAAWEAGDRRIICALRHVDGDSMVGSARGTRR
jgi:hypothetical protein